MSKQNNKDFAKTEKAWRAIVEERDIAAIISSKGHYEISAADIKTVGKREPRLMAKFDTVEGLPPVFKELSMCITTISNGMYLLYKDKGYRSYLDIGKQYKETEERLFVPKEAFELETLKFAPNLSESKAIDYAHHSGLLGHVIGDDNLRLTSRGRFFSSDFELKLSASGKPFIINKAQIEVDSGYEGIDTFTLFEAKSGKRKSFNIRQLYYPYSHYVKFVKKPIKNFLVEFSNGIYYFTEVCFDSSGIYYDYVPLRTVAYKIHQPGDVFFDVDKALGSPVISSGSIPLPQADDVNKVLDLGSLLLNKSMSGLDVALKFGLVSRQGDYYPNALAYIGLAERVDGKFVLTPVGRKVFSIENRRLRNAMFANAILSTRLFKDLMSVYLRSGYVFVKQEMLDRLSKENINGSTIERRYTTAKRWLEWIRIYAIEGN
ncbi:type II restriction enzyme [Hymenobacter sp. CRA2]|uniref:type II restriction enzyme n=1 Tax=Hymenobacter sp. CRA2 TaxID=1955620 RepID=UPI001117AA6B|nr:hypothetical protein [Hymenobacter sp. CRA2]